MTTSYIAATPKKQFFDNAGNPASGYKLYTYLSGTTTPATTYQDQAGTSANTNPIILDSRGECLIWLPGTQEYTFTLKTAADVTVWSVSDISGSASKIDLDTVAATVSDLASDLAASSGSSLVGFIQPDTGAAARTEQSKLRDTVSIKDFGAVGDGTTLDDTAFASAAATGKKIELIAGETYYLASGKSLVSGGGFICPYGYATIKLKTGSGGFNITNVGGTRTDLDRCVFSCVNVDNIDLEGLKFTTDGTKEVVIYPIRTSDGMDTNGIRIKRIRFSGLSALSGGYISLNTVGEGSYLVDDIYAKDCGTAQGNTYWTGTPQITIVEVDNDMVASTHSVSGIIRNIYGKNILFSGTALTDFGQQTDGINIAGIGSNEKGPIIDGVHLDGIGEGLDLFCSYATATNIYIKNAYNYGIKLIHGARYNNINVGSIENFGRAAVLFSGGTSTTTDTENNIVNVSAIIMSASYGGPGAETAAVLFSDNGGGGATCLPKNNTCNVERVVGDSTYLQYAVRDGGAHNANNNIVTIGSASGWSTAFCSALNDNERIICPDSTEVTLTLGSAQAITPAADTKVDFSVVVKDAKSEADTANDKVRCKFPGRKQVSGQVRATSLSSGDLVELRIVKNTTVIAQNQLTSTGTGQVIVSVATVVYIDEDVVSTADADLSMQVRITSAGSPVLTQSAELSRFQVVAI